MVKTELNNRGYKINKTELYTKYPQLPNSIYIYSLNRQKARNILLNEKYVKPSGMLKWNDTFNISEQQWSKIFFLPFMFTGNTKLRWFQVELNIKSLETIIFYTN